MQSTLTRIFLLVSATSLCSCGWVDSTGTQGEQAGSDKSVELPLVQFESSVKTLVEGHATALLEKTTNRTQLDGVSRTVNEWSWQLIDEGDSEACEDISGFDPLYSADTLEDACTATSQCTIQIEETTSLEEPEFIVSVPSLSSSVALTYSVSSELDDGQTNSRDQVICALAVNEAPNPGNDSYKVLAGVLRTVRAQDFNNLLGNDVDDLDNRNQPLEIDTNVVIAPIYADDFSLRSDGSFVYRVASDIPLNDNGKLTDTFVYSVSDGLHNVTATATLTIVASNSNPLAVGTLPEALIDISTDNSAAPYILNVSDYFNDADGDQLHYNIDTSNLPEELPVTLSDEGLLTVDIHSNDFGQSPGQWQVNIEVSDGLDIATTDFQLTLFNSASNSNRAPVAGDISNRIVQNSFEYDVSNFFNDPDGDELTYSSDSLPPGVTLSSSGILSGNSKSQNRGVWLITIQATDSFGESASDRFRLIIS